MAEKASNQKASQHDSQHSDQVPSAGPNSITIAPPVYGMDFVDYGLGGFPGQILQTKLKINQPGDEYERQADRIANQVITKTPNRPVNEVLLHIQRYSEQSTAQTEAVSASVNRALASPAKPLEPTLRNDMEQRFGYDFSQVRIHTGDIAEQSARDVNAHAYTVGHNIIFDTGRFSPQSHDGQRLIAHELTHTIQQNSVYGNFHNNREAVQFNHGFLQREARTPIRVMERRIPIASGGGTSTDAESLDAEVQSAGDISIYVGKTMTAEAALREIYRQSARKVTDEALRMIAKGTSVEDAARWAIQARNDLKVAIRARGSAIVRAFAEARNIKKYGNKIGPTFEELIREGKTPKDIIGSAGRASEKVNRVATKLKVGGRFFIGVDLAIVTWEVIYAPEGERIRTAVGGVAGVAGAAGGGWAGAKGGAAAGFFLGGPPGAAIGGIIGGIGGALVGGWLGRKAGEKAYDLVDDLVNPPSGSIWELQTIVIDGIEDERIRTYTQHHP